VNLHQYSEPIDVSRFDEATPHRTQVLPTNLCRQRLRLRIAGSLVANIPTSSSKTSSATDRAFPQLQGQIWLTSPDLAQIVPVDRPVDFTATLQRSIESARSH
jgi:hypothetical protein